MQTVLTDDLGDGVRLVSLNRPHRLNAIIPEMVEALAAAVEAADRDGAVRAIVLTGQGRAFCSGADLKELASDTPDEAATAAYIDRRQDVTRAVALDGTPAGRRDPRLRRIAALPAGSVRDLRRVLARRDGAGLAAALAAEAAACVRGTLDPETTQRVAKFTGHAG